MKLLIAMLLCLAGAAHAKEPLVVMYGSGTNTCGDYLGDRAKNSEAVNTIYASYVYGYITGMNQFARTAGMDRQVQGGLSTATVLAFADKYCREHPLEIFAGAINSLISAKVQPFTPPDKP